MIGQVVASSTIRSIVYWNPEYGGLLFMNNSKSSLGLGVQGLGCGVYGSCVRGARV